VPQNNSDFRLPPALVFLDSRLEVLSDKARARSVTSLRLGSRAINVLESAGVCSTGDLVDAAQKGLPAYRGLGASSFDEISFALESLVKKTGKKNSTVEARYSAFGRRIFFFRAQSFKRISHYQLNRPVSELGLGKEALAFAGGRCLASSLGRFLEKCAEGVRGIRCEYARPIPEIVHALLSLARSVSEQGKVNWRTYRRLSGLSFSPEPEVAAAALKKVDHVPPNLTPSSSSSALVHYPGHYARVHFEFPELASLSEKSKQLGLEPLLSRRPFNIYSSMGVCTLGALVELASKGFRQTCGYGRKCYTETELLLRSAASIIDDNGDVDIEALCKAAMRPFIPVVDTGARDVLDAAISAQFPVLRYTSPKLEQLSKSARRQPIHNLHLDSRAATTMESLGVADVGGFVDKLQQGINGNKLRNFGRKAFKEVVSAITSLSSSINDQGDCDWIAYAAARGFEVLPSEVVETHSEAVQQLADAAEQAVAAQFGSEKDFSRHMSIFKGRIHSLIGDHLTLEQLGARHSLSRERIRQNETHIVKCLSASSLGGIYSVPVIRGGGKTHEALRFRFRPAFESTLQLANAAMNADRRKVWRLDEWIHFLSELWHVDLQFVERNALLLSVIFRFSVEGQTLDGETKGFLLISEEVSSPVRQDFRDLLKDIHLSMRGSSDRLSADEVIEPFDFASVLREFAISPDQLLALCPALSSDREGLWKVKPEFYKPDAAKLTRDAVYEILRSQGTRMHKADIIRIFKAKHPDLFGNERVFVVRIACDARFDALNKSGFWVLSEWNKETGTIRQILDRVLRSSSGPMSLNDILASVRRIVPCAESSIRHHLLHSQGKYIRLSKTVFDLASRHADGDA
jgi:hypothetical protein